MPTTLRKLFILTLTGLAVAGAAAARDGEPEQTVRVYAAGDIAMCPGSPADSAAAATARMLPDDATVLVLGDTAYPRADRETLQACYQPTWGRFLAHTYAVPGNHDYVDGSPKAFLDYFGMRIPGKTWFRVALGEWWIIGLDSNIKGSELEEQRAWLERELKSIDGDGRCILALWHHPLFSTGLHHGDGKPMKPVWALLDQAGADLVLSGHEHFYESFEPMDAEGHRASTGLREIIAGIGGAPLSDFSLSGRHKAYAREHGILELDLEPAGYQYRYRTLSGQVRDEGGASCRRAADLQHP